VRQSTGGDVGINGLIRADLGVVLTPIARIHRLYIRRCTGSGRDALQHGLQVLHIRWLVAHTHRHDHLVVDVAARMEQLCVHALLVQLYAKHLVTEGEIQPGPLALWDLVVRASRALPHPAR